MAKDLKETQKHIAELFGQCSAIPKEARIVLRNDTTKQQTTVLHCDWRLAKPQPGGSSNSSREITLQLTQSATQKFRDAENVALQTLDTRLRNLVRNRLRDGYKETDSQQGPFIIRIDDHDLD